MRHTSGTTPLRALLRRSLRLLSWPLPALVSAACTSTTRHPASKPTQVILRFTYDAGKPMRHDDDLEGLS